MKTAISGIRKDDNDFHLSVLDRGVTKPRELTASASLRVVSSLCDVEFTTPKLPKEYDLHSR
jgi:hypothetical protein